VSKKKIRYLTNKLLGEIRKNVNTFVANRIDESELGKECEELRELIERNFRSLMNQRYPKEDIEVLRKYNCLAIFSKISFGIRDGKALDYISVYNKYTLVFYDVIEVPHTKRELLQDLPNELNDQLILWHDMYDKLCCEQKNVVSAYMSAISKYKTVHTLLNAYPEYGKFIPKEEIQKSEKTEISEAEKIINLFEESITDGVE
jgi:hypothetical protein